MAVLLGYGVACMSVALCEISVDIREELTAAVSACTANVLSEHKACSKKDRTFTVKTLLLILQHLRTVSLQRSPLYWRYTVPNASYIVGMLPGTHFL